MKRRDSQFLIRTENRKHHDNMIRDKWGKRQIWRTCVLQNGGFFITIPYSLPFSWPQSIEYILAYPRCLHVFWSLTGSAMARFFGTGAHCRQCVFLFKLRKNYEKIAGKLVRWEIEGRQDCRRTTAAAASLERMRSIKTRERFSAVMQYIQPFGAHSQLIAPLCPDTANLKCFAKDFFLGFILLI